MALKIVEIHNPALRIDGSETGLATNRSFYEGVLGLTANPKRPTLPGIPGLWINVGEIGQLHLIGGTQPSPLAKEGPDKDPAGPHVALAVQDVVEARRTRPAGCQLLGHSGRQRSAGAAAFPV